MMVYWSESGCQFRTPGISNGPLEWWDGQRWVIVRLSR